MSYKIAHSVQRHTTDSQPFGKYYNWLLRLLLFERAWSPLLKWSIDIKEQGETSFGRWKSRFARQRKLSTQTIIPPWPQQLPRRCLAVPLNVRSIFHVLLWEPEGSIVVGSRSRATLYSYWQKRFRLISGDIDVECSFRDTWWGSSARLPACLSAFLPVSREQNCVMSNLKCGRPSVWVCNSQFLFVLLWLSRDRRNVWR